MILDECLYKEYARERFAKSFEDAMNEPMIKYCPVCDGNNKNCENYVSSSSIEREVRK